MNTNSYTLLPTESNYGVLIIDGGTVHRSSINTETFTWICRMMGFQSYYTTTTSYSYSWQQSFPIRYIYPECSGSVVPQCRYRRYGTYYGSALWIYCNPRSQKGDSTQFYLAGKDKQHTQKEHGLLMYNGGTVSGKKFDDSTADLVCRIMGYESVMSWNVGRNYMPGQKDLSISLSSVNCLTKDRPFPLCTYGTDVTNSTHDEDVWLWCDMPNNNDLVCPPGQKKSGSNKCYECGPNTYSPEPSTSTSCLSCPSRSTSPTGSTYCSCNEGTYMSPDNDECLECPRNSSSLNGSSFCSCVAGTFLYSDLSSCVLCPSGKVSKEGGTAPSDCVSCPAGSVPLNNGQVCSCEKGYGWEWGLDMEQSCKVCPANSFKDKRQGICVQCPDEATSLPLSESCQCSGGLSWDGKSCVDCTTPGSSSGMCNCSGGTFWSDSQCRPCPRNYFSGNHSTVCLKCPTNTVSDRQSSECSYCSVGYAWQNYTCTECPENHVGNGAVCSICPTESVPLTNKDVCSCEKGYGWEWSNSGEGSCKACPANYYKEKEQGTCKRCPHEATSLPLSEECHCPGGLSWDGESCVNCTSPGSSSGVCNCSAGTFWSEDTTLCEPCPANHFSGQFFSLCSKCPVFTVSESHSSECSSCPKGYSWKNQTCIECPEYHVGNGATCSVCPEGTSPSKDKTICQKSAVDALSVVSLVLCILILTLVIGIIFYIWKEKREKDLQEDIHMVYQADLSTTDAKVRGRRCMCPSCPCSEVAKPALPKRGNTLQQDDIYANN